MWQNIGYVKLSYHYPNDFATSGRKVGKSQNANFTNKRN